MLWRAQRLVVELDGYAFHQYRRPFERDRDRDADLVAAGYSVIRITWQRLTRQTDREMRRLRRLLDPAEGLSSSRV
jgi:very-short-patch-repair endonuclease